MDNEIKELEKKIRETRRKVPSTKLLESERESSKSSNTGLENRIQQVRMQTRTHEITQYINVLLDFHILNYKVHSSVECCFSG